MCHLMDTTETTQTPVKCLMMILKMCLNLLVTVFASLVVLELHVLSSVLVLHFFVVELDEHCRLLVVASHPFVTFSSLSACSASRYDSIRCLYCPVGSICGWFLNLWLVCMSLSSVSVPT